MYIKTSYLSILLFLTISTLGCQKKLVYVAPQITGQVIDKQTNQPIEGVKTVINRQALDYTDKQGRFTVPFTTVEYTFNEPSYQESRSRRGASLAIFKEGYEYKSYTNGGLAFTTSADSQKRYVNMGKIYLMPVPAGKEAEYKTEYLTVGYCKPTQSQREVDCIPVTEGKKYEQVSPNQPVQ
ncbi:hypothetical protein [Psychrobacter okhotskensis]|uniref:hypothetical protein n=1 Tax=Psychrobacter okhotskensis TaxID=212403 RepID=UPI003D066B10